MPKKRKLIIYEQIMRPILIYGSETWTLTTRLKSQIQAAEMKVLRLIYGVTRLNRIRNDVIREDLKVTSNVKLIERNRRRWYGHIQRLSPERYPKRY